jgi:hypothetical protein
MVNMVIMDRLMRELLRYDLEASMNDVDHRQAQSDAETKLVYW